MKTEFVIWNKTVQMSLEGRDYSEGKLFEQPVSHFWMHDDKYKPFIKDWINRPEYRERIILGR